MFERFTDRSRKVLALANQEAVRFHHEYIGSEHLLLGIIKEGSGVGAYALQNHGLDLGKIRTEVEKRVKSGHPDTVTIGKLPHTPRAKVALEFAIEEARNMGHKYVGTEHLLLGLLREPACLAAQVLMSLDIDLESIRKEICALLGINQEPTDEDKLIEKLKSIAGQEFNKDHPSHHSGWIGGRADLAKELLEFFKKEL